MQIIKTSARSGRRTSLLSARGGEFLPALQDGHMTLTYSDPSAGVFTVILDAEETKELLDQNGE